MDSMSQSQVDPRLLSTNVREQPQQPQPQPPQPRQYPGTERRALQQEQQGESRRFYEKLGYPRYAGKYDPFEVPSGMRVISIAETPKGLQITFKSTQQQMLSLAPTVSPARQFVLAKRSILASPARRYQIMKRLKQAEIQPSEPILTRTVRVHGAHAAEYDPSQELNLPHGPRTFYLDIGYPQYQDKYEPFTVPEGYKIGNIKETKTGLDVTFELAKKAEADDRGLAERMMDVKIETPKGGYLGQFFTSKLSYPGTKSNIVRPLDVPAGVVASGESLVYGVGRLAGFQTPRIPPTVMGGLIGKAFGSTEMEDVAKYGPGYMVGTAFGDILIGYGIGKVSSAAWSKLPKTITKPVSGVFEKAGTKIRYGLEDVGLLPKRLSPMVVSVPSPERVGLAGIEAQETAWEIATMPRASAYLISKMPSESLTKAWALEHLYKTAYGGLAYATIQEELARSETLLPHVPSVPEQSFKVSPTMSGLILESGLMGQPKTSVESFQKQQLRMGLVAEPQQKQRGKPSLMSFGSTMQKAQSKASLLGELAISSRAVTTQALRSTQRQLLRQTQRLEPQIRSQFSFPKVSELPRSQTMFENEFQLPKRKRQKSVKYGLVGRYKRKYPLATAKDLLKMVSK